MWDELQLGGWSRGSKQELCLIGSSVPEAGPGQKLGKEGWEENAFEKEGGGKFKGGSEAGSGLHWSISKSRREKSLEETGTCLLNPSPLAIE